MTPVAPSSVTATTFQDIQPNAFHHFPSVARHLTHIFEIFEI
jgi:hypothetical protein